MRRQPEYLTTFHADRELVKKVLGDGRFLVTPCTLACPFESAVCTKGLPPAQSLWRHLQDVQAQGEAAW